VSLYVWHELRDWLALVVAAIAAFGHVRPWRARGGARQRDDDPDAR
jgi:hypothetical protein